QTQLPQLRSQGRSTREVDRPQAHLARSLHVTGAVVDEDGARDVDRETFDQQAKDRRIGLDQPDSSGDENALEPTQEFVALERDWKSILRPVRQGQQADVAVAQDRKSVV